MFINFNMDGDVDMKEDQADVDPYHDEEEMEDVRLDKKRERHWRMIFEENDGGVENEKSLLHTKR